MCTHFCFLASAFFSSAPFLTMRRLGAAVLLLVALCSRVGAFTALTNIGFGDSRAHTCSKALWCFCLWCFRPGAC